MLCSVVLHVRWWCLFPFVRLCLSLGTFLEFECFLFIIQKHCSAVSKGSCFQWYNEIISYVVCDLYEDCCCCVFFFNEKLIDFDLFRIVTDDGMKRTIHCILGGPMFVHLVVIGEEIISWFGKITLLCYT